MKAEKSSWSYVPKAIVPPDFNNVLAVLRRERPSRPTLFEFFLNERLYQRLSRARYQSADLSRLDNAMVTAQGFLNAGYDYAILGLPRYTFPAREAHQDKTRSLNEGFIITDRDSFTAYAWPDPAKLDYGILDKVGESVPDGMKLIAHGPGGVLENMIRLVGLDNLCLMIADDPELVWEIASGIGSRLVTYYTHCLEHPSVGAIVGNDDWGFKSQTMLSPEDLRRFVFPWHKKIVSAAHAAGKPAILHSCGCLGPVMDDIIGEMGYDGKHSYEDTIQPVEDAYDAYHKRIAILGGIDVDFVCRHTPEEIYERSKKMLERVSSDGAYALGTGNSVPEYVPDDHYFAMTRAVLDFRRW